MLIDIYLKVTYFNDGIRETVFCHRIVCNRDNYFDLITDTNNDKLIIEVAKNDIFCITIEDKKE